MTGQKTWAVGEEVLAPDFNNYVQSQVVPQFANVAARDAWTTAPNGALCVTIDTNTVWQRKSGAWAQFPTPPQTTLGQVLTGVPLSATLPTSQVITRCTQDLTLPGPGKWIATYVALVASTSPLAVTFRMYAGASSYFDYKINTSSTGCSVCFSVAVLPSQNCAVYGICTGAAPATVYGDGTNHALMAMGGL